MRLNNDQLRARAREYALRAEVVNRRPHARDFWPKFRQDVDSLHQFAAGLSTMRAACGQPAEDWLLDHIAFVETQAQAVSRELPRGVFAQLPRLADSPKPRVYALCEAYLHGMEGEYDAHGFEHYLQAYQEVSVLTSLECWILPSAMRVVIIHALAEAMHEVRHRHAVCDKVTTVMGPLVNAESPDRELKSVLDHLASRQPLSPVEIVHVVRHLNEWGAKAEGVRTWLLAYVASREIDLMKMTSFEHQLQAHLQVTVGDLVTSLHRLEREPWRSTFTRICRIEEILRAGAEDEYDRLDFSSQDQLRGRIEKMARQLRVSEPLVAETAVAMAAGVRDGDSASGPGPRSANVAYYLLDPKGILELGRRLSGAKQLHPRHLMNTRIRPWSFYLGSISVLFVALMLATGYWIAYSRSVVGWAWAAVFLALAFPVSEWVVTIVQAAIVRWYPARALLRYDFSLTVPRDARTMVVVPIIWANRDEVDDVVSRLEVHFLANRQRHLYFAILGDYEDALTETLPGDEELVAYAADEIDRLRDVYGADRFFLFHRRRRYNPAEGVFMGWERKRGKLVEFVELLSGKATTSFSTVHGDRSVLSQIRYVFTVDHDTKLPIGVVSRLVGTMHLPYNRPRLNDNESRVIEGFGVLQPRIAVSYEAARSSRFAALWAGEPGIDPYAFAVSHPYQNLFGEATFVGKGLFDVQAFLKTVVERVPENLVLSHDLLEGGFLRTGLTPDIEVVEDHPSSFYAYQRRQDRWIRGDWQLLHWVRPRCPNRRGQRQPVDLAGLARLQIVDNLRRSLLAPALFVVALLGLSALPGRSRDAWEGVVLVTLFLPFLQSVMEAMLGNPRLTRMGTAFGQSLVQLVTLPFVTVAALIAVVRTLYRLFISKRNLLEWVPARRTNHHNEQVFVYEREGYLAILLFTVWAWSSAASDHWLGVLLPVVWLMARPMMQRMNRAYPALSRPWVPEVSPQLEDWARQIWSFFERYVTAAESWLPPDNVQYLPREIVAHRTSPTNIGLYLLSVVAARDLRFIDAEEMLDRLEKSLSTVVKLSKWNGHLFNWYSTETALPLEPQYVSTVDSGNLVAYLMVVRQALGERAGLDPKQSQRSLELIRVLAELIEATDFRLLFSPDARLFALGYNVGSQQKETTLYDLLASEARQTSFVAIALGQIPASHWFTLGRAMTQLGPWKTLLSWSGTMFEYLLPSLILRTYRQSIWEATYHGVIRRQQEYAARLGVPFGVSESGYYQFDYQLNYQYHAFGVPGLGLNSGLEEDLVIAPYATMMALPYAGESALKALAMLESLGAKGEYGFYEAVDYTRRRLSRGKTFEVVQSFMAHHQAMSLLTLTNLLKPEVMVERMQSDPHVRAAELLLQERVPARPALMALPIGTRSTLPNMDGESDSATRHVSTIGPYVHVNVISNGRLASMTREDGGGALNFLGLEITRWREDPVVSSSGLAIYLRDAESEAMFSPTRYPCQTSSQVDTTFRLNRSEFRGLAQDLRWSLEVTVHPDIDAEVRTLEVQNVSAVARRLEVTSFVELALAAPAADRAHLAYSKLFVQTSHDPAHQCLVAHRRRRDQNEAEVWAVHTMYVEAGGPADYQFETDRAEFIGRTYSLSWPQGSDRPLLGSAGAVVDPAFIMRRTLHLEAGESSRIYFVTGAAASREGAIEIVDRLREPSQIAQAFHLAWIRTQIDLHHMALSPEQANEAQLLAGSLLYPAPLTPARTMAVQANRLGQSRLWARAISGDRPIVVVSIQNLADLPFLTVIARQHRYLRSLGLDSDLVIVDQTGADTTQILLERLADYLRARGLGPLEAVTCIAEQSLFDDERHLLKAVARVWIDAGGASVRAQLHMNEDHHRIDETRPSVCRPWVLQRPTAPRREPEGEFFNGWGGFVDDARAYRIQLQSDRPLPRPWTNVLANPEFGTLVTELGTGYTWSANAREHKLTPWNNDPVLDPPGECLYLCDVATKTIWSATPSPAGDAGVYTTTHGWGWSQFEQTAGEITHQMTMTVAPDDPVKVIHLRLANHSQRAKKIRVAYYAEWVMGVSRDHQAQFLVSEWDQASNALFARNTYQEAFSGAVAVLHMNVVHSISTPTYSWTGDRGEFIGYGGSMAHPLGLAGDLSCQTGAFTNACGVVQAVVEIAPEGEVDVVVVLGCAASLNGARDLVDRYRHLEQFSLTMDAVRQQWQHVTSAVTVKTPDRAMDILLNGWLLYQTLSCRLWARTGFYQAGGAFGFRDQLQDTLALLHADPVITRDQILRNAGHQYESGDVQHWWHDMTQKGIRTRIADDLLWLPYAVSRYVEHTGDLDLLQIVAPYLTSPLLEPNETERYEATTVSPQRGTILDHCLRAISHASRFGSHGLPLMGSGDWNDGMNQVGPLGQGESVWLGWFLLDVCNRFVRLNRVRPDTLTDQQAARFGAEAARLIENLNTFAWDGQWYRRAYTDSGTWIGSAENPEGRIDAIAQSWSVISGGAPKDRQLTAMHAFDQELVDRQVRLVRLLADAFDVSMPSPGYIQGYPPGIRENGGQYTHGVIWSVVAWAMLKRRDRAFELFSLLNPIGLTDSEASVRIYGNEPYVMSADVYTAPNYLGRGGWSWYTGSAGWMYQAGLEYVLGIQRRSDRLYIEPCVPDHWGGFTIQYRYHRTTYVIEVEIEPDRGDSATEWIVDGGEPTPNVGYLQLHDDGKTHAVRMRPRKPTTVRV